MKAIMQISVTFSGLFYSSSHSMEKCVHTLGKQADAYARTPGIISRHNKYSPPSLGENTIVTNYSNQWEYKQTKPEWETDRDVWKKRMDWKSRTGRQEVCQRVRRDVPPEGRLSYASLPSSIPSNTQINKSPGGRYLTASEAVELHTLTMTLNFSACKD